MNWKTKKKVIVLASRAAFESTINFLFFVIIISINKRTVNESMVNSIRCEF